eukprot:TRINITY_DN4085_c0_g3_i2.p1 TRINITY_DN4085_c0_g3~~TRINITY_DN4085_c0_g3_i2.p1  ORF type:complete len:239 (+),score=44.67 TRINITY_DN4085_c0_g3_i2:215-931(+)
MAYMFPVCPSKASMNDRHLLQVVREAEGDNFLFYCPEWRAAYHRISNAYQALCDLTHQAYTALRGLENPRDFGLQAGRYVFDHALFAMRKYGVTPQQYYASIPLVRLEKVMRQVTRSEWKHKHGEVFRGPGSGKRRKSDWLGGRGGRGGKWKHRERKRGEQKNEGDEDEEEDESEEEEEEDSEEEEENEEGESDGENEGERERKESEKKASEQNDVFRRYWNMPRGGWGTSLAAILDE